MRGRDIIGRWKQKYLKLNLDQREKEEEEEKSHTYFLKQNLFNDESFTHFDRDSLIWALL